ncbi:MAG: retroviral-like aspartic protease family protein [Paludibacteraceae bacterium]|nr:retroviral-like aspartic protease family protein [Paludibacteraceae bacterium]
MKNNIWLLSVCLIMLLPSCVSKTKPTALDMEYDDVQYDDVVAVPYKEDISGVKTVDVKINDCLSCPMIFDTGCSGLSISALELAILYKNGCVSDNEYIGKTYCTIADGSIVEVSLYRIEFLQIGELLCQNVMVSVDENLEAPLLLGQGVLGQVQKYTVDNENKYILFHLK